MDETDIAEYSQKTRFYGLIYDNLTVALLQLLTKIVRADENIETLPHKFWSFVEMCYYGIEYESQS